MGSTSPGSRQSHCIPGEPSPRGPSPVPRVPEAPALQRPEPAYSYISRRPGVMIYLLLQLHLLETGRDDLSAPERGKNLVEKPNHLNAFQMNVFFRIRERLASGPVMGATVSLLKIISSLSC